MKAGASVNEVDTTKDKFTPIHWACHKGALEVGLIMPRISPHIVLDGCWSWYERFYIYKFLGL